MIVLGFDTATPATAVGLMLSDGRFLEARDDPREGERPGHSTRLLGLAAQLLEQADVHWSEVQRIAVGLGPGTFTGLRIGVATVRGLAQALGAQLAGVCSPAALAHSALGEADNVLAAIDARRGEVFAAAYRDATELVAPRPLPPQRLAEVLEQAGAAGSWLAVGDGALRYAEHLRPLGVTLPDERSPLHRIGARAVCELGAEAESGELAEHYALVPSYGREPDAKPPQRGWTAAAAAPQGAGG